MDCPPLLCAQFTWHHHHPVKPEDHHHVWTSRSPHHNATQNRSPRPPSRISPPFQRESGVFPARPASIPWDGIKMGMPERPAGTCPGLPPSRVRGGTKKGITVSKALSRADNSPARSLHTSLPRSAPEKGGLNRRIQTHLQASSVRPGCARNESAEVRPLHLPSG